MLLGGDAPEAPASAVTPSTPLTPLFSPFFISLKRTVGTSVIVVALAGLSLQLEAQTLTREQAQGLRKDAETATTAIDQLGKAVTAPDGRKHVETARDAVGRITEQLDAYIAKQELAASDIYDGGKKYPAIAKVRIEDFDVPVGATVVHVPVTLDKPSVNTVVAHVRVYNGDGGRAVPDATKPVVFRPGDPLTKTASFAVSDMKEGNTLKAVQAQVPDGATRQGGGIVITAKAGAVNVPIEVGRAPLAFAPLGTLTYSETGRTIRYDDKGGPMTFSTALAHGRTQVGNGETGYYGTVDMGGFSRTEEGLVLSSRRLDQSMKVGAPAMEYPFLATMLSGHKTPESWFKYGSVEWVVKMPNRPGSWPALWLVPTGGWPPEIDVYEGFGYNGSWKFASDLSTNLHGGKNQVRTFTRPGMNMKMSSFGLANTLDSEFHVFSVTVDPEWITMFIDGIETMRYANPFKGQNWYPLTNVAVKAKMDSPYDQGAGAMVLRSLKIWRSE
ncbi:family 16 glycosylhydrolase [Rariglobus hedericola]